MTFQFTIFDSGNPNVNCSNSMKILISTLILFFSFTSFPQSEEYIFKQFTDSDGLSQSTIFAMVQDEQGFLWLGTIDGLNRYDGYEFKVYINDPADASAHCGRAIAES